MTYPLYLPQVSSATVSVSVCVTTLKLPHEEFQDATWVLTNRVYHNMDGDGDMGAKDELGKDVGLDTSHHNSVCAQ